MRDNEYLFAFDKSENGAPHLRFILRIERRRHFVERHDGCVPRQRAGNRNAPVAPAYADPFSPIVPALSKQPGGK